MNEIIEQHWPHALDLVQQYETDQFAFADLAGLIEEFSATYTNHINELPESQRALANSALEARIEAEMNGTAKDSKASQALNELRVSINRTPIY